MAYIGSEPNTIFRVAPVKDTFTGDGSTTTFDLANLVPAGGENALQVFIDNVRQEPGSGKAYTLGNDGSGDLKRITFSAAPANSSAIYVLTNFDNEAFINTDINGQELFLDADGDTSITSDTDDQIDVKIAGADDFKFTANNFNVLSGSTLTIDSGATITNSGTATGFTTKLDDVATGDAASTLATSAGNITIDAQGGDTDIIFKGTDGSTDITALTIDMSEGGILTTRAGVGFPATQVASTDVNVLDDYEEGTFVPTIGSLTLNDKFGHYTKVGRAVHVQGYVDMGSQSGGTTMVMGGLPFTSANNTQHLDVTGNYASDKTQALRVQANSTNASLIAKTEHSDNNNSDYNYNDMNNKFFYFHGTYFV